MDIFKRVIRIVSYVFLTFCLVALIFCGLSSDVVVVVSYDISSSDVSNPFTCLVISDYHHRSLNAANGNIIDIISKQSDVDAVFFTGDLIDTHTTSLDDVSKLFDVANDISNNHCYFVTGNHEQYAPLLNDLMSLIGSKGITYLHDDSSAPMNDVTIYGIDDARFTLKNDSSFTKREEVIKEEIAKLPARDPSNFSILLVHRPENFRMIANDYDFDLVISGHTHGGQIQIGNWVPATIGFDEKAFVSGKYHIDDSDLIISRGLGYSAMFPLRVNCNPEITKITIK